PIVKFVEIHVEPMLGDRIRKKETIHKFARGIGISVGLAVAIALVVALCNMVIPELYKSIRDLIITLPGQLNQAVVRINE
ncbi:MAG: AI-2E family transporter, partial [Lachnospiraceae bacterium]